MSCACFLVCVMRVMCVRMCVHVCACVLEGRCCKARMAGKKAHGSRALLLLGRGSLVTVG